MKVLEELEIHLVINLNFFPWRWENIKKEKRQDSFATDNHYARKCHNFWNNELCSLTSGLLHHKFCQHGFFARQCDGADFLSNLVSKKKKPHFISSYTAILVIEFLWRLNGWRMRNQTQILVLTVLLMTISVCPLSVFKQQNFAAGAYGEHESPDQLSGLSLCPFPSYPCLPRSLKITSCNGSLSVLSAGVWFMVISCLFSGPAAGTESNYNKNYPASLA